MPTQFKYRAVATDGRHERGVINAPGSAEAAEHLKNRHLFPISITPVSDSTWLSRLGLRKGNLNEQLIMFTTSLATMYRAGIPLLRALTIIRVGKSGSRFNYVLDQVRMQVQGGQQLSEAMAGFDDIFSRVYVACVRAGEESGKLESTLEELSKMLEQEGELNRQLKSGVRYPLIVVLIIVAAIIVLMTLVVPRFVDFYASFDAELPMATRVIIGISNAVVGYWPLLLLAVIATGFAYGKLCASSKGRLWRDEKLLKVPVIGDLIIKGNVARFCLIFRILFDSGLPIVKSLSIVAQTTRNSAIGMEVSLLEEVFRRGQDADLNTGQTKYFPQQALQMISIGLETGDLTGMLKQLGDYYSKQVEYISRHLTAIIEPILTVVLGAFVLILALAIFLPMWNLIKVFGG